MKLEPNMYVRTKNGAIAKIEQIVDDEIHFNIKPIFSDGEEFGYNWLYIKDVIKASHNIIDLIEAGDIVVLINGMRKEELMLIKNLDKEIHILNTHKIVSIVTKEQFESMSYKID